MLFMHTVKRRKVAYTYSPSRTFFRHCLSCSVTRYPPLVVLRQDDNILEFVLYSGEIECSDPPSTLGKSVVCIVLYFVRNPQTP